MKKFNVALLSDDLTMKMCYFFNVHANSENHAIQLAQDNLREIIKKDYGNLRDIDELINTEVLDFTPMIFEIKVID